MTRREIIMKWLLENEIFDIDAYLKKHYLDEDDLEEVEDDINSSIELIGYLPKLHKLLYTVGNFGEYEMLYDGKTESVVDCCHVSGNLIDDGLDEEVSDVNMSRRDVLEQWIFDSRIFDLDEYNWDMNGEGDVDFVYLGELAGLKLYEMSASTDEPDADKEFLLILYDEKTESVVDYCLDGNLEIDDTDEEVIFKP